MAATLGNIPELAPILAPQNPIVPYIDSNPLMNSVARAIYQMEPGQVLIIWTGTVLETATMSKWIHAMELCYRCLPDESDLDLGDAIVNGVPNPGDGMYWRNCPLMDGLLPTEVKAIERRTDTEGVDYQVILTETAETGDYPNP